MADNNFGHFTGLGRLLWQERARGFQPEVVRGQLGSRLRYAPDQADGFAIQNGGIAHPQETKIKPGRYYRFYATIDHNRFGPSAFTGGNWWMDYETFARVESWSEEHGLALAAAARALLLIPREWSDCGYLGVARLEVTLKAWVGKGKPASAGVSPDSAARGSSLSGEAYTPVSAALPTNADVKQYFVPGERTQLARWFKFESRRRAR